MYIMCVILYLFKALRRRVGVYKFPLLLLLLLYIVFVFEQFSALCFIELLTFDNKMYQMFYVNDEPEGKISTQRQ